MSAQTQNKTPTDAEIKRSMEIIDGQSVGTLDIRKERDPKRRMILIDSVIDGMVSQGDYRPNIAKAMMLLWCIRNNVDVDQRKR